MGAMSGAVGAPPLHRGTTWEPSPRAPYWHRSPAAPTPQRSPFPWTPLPWTPQSRPRIPTPPIPRLPLSLRERLCGHQSHLFIGMMLLRVGWSIVQAIRATKDLHHAVIGGTIYLMALLIASPDRRLRVPAVGILCGLIWSYALADPALPANSMLAHWPVLLLLGVLAALVEGVYTWVGEQLGAATSDGSASEAMQLAQASLVLQAISTLMFVAPVVIITLDALSSYTLRSSLPFDVVSFALSLPPVIGVGVYALFVLRRVREVSAAVVGA